MTPERPAGAGVNLKAFGAQESAAHPKPAKAPRHPGSEASQLYAALDLGTNSCRMLIARPVGGHFEV
ncbi:MAG: Ppx/GppA family phosphatase, partial [Roseinatronobacter sp.]|nr:Ppx/GppA family phosphatase [Roseinatronobacter sp.]